MKKIFVFFSIILFVFASQAQEYSKQDEANYIMGFARFMQWSQYEGNQIIVNVLGESVVQDNLNFMAQTNQVAGRKLLARQTNISNVSECNILFVTAEKIDLLPEILNQTINKSVLIITETPNMTSSGADVSFAHTSSSLNDSTLTYTFNLNSIKAKNIKVAIEFIGYGKH